MWSIVLFLVLAHEGQLVIEPHMGREQYATYEECHEAVAEIVAEHGEPASNQALACVRVGPEREA